MKAHHAIILAIAATLLAEPGQASAAGEIYQPPLGFWIAPSNHDNTLYAPTSSSANWHVSQWSIPQDLPGFNAQGVAQNQSARVAWLGAGRYELSQDGSSLPCYKVFPSGRRLPDEFDLFTTPNNIDVPGYPQAAGAGAGISLDAVTSLDASITLDVTRADEVDASCPITRTAFLLAVVLSNPVSRQTLFLQIQLGTIRFDNPNSEITTGWFFKGRNNQSGGVGAWGYNDNVTSYGQPWASVGGAETYRLDLLPRLRGIIADGEDSGLDQDLSHWRVAGTYHGQSVWGHVRNDVIWSGFSLATE